MSIDRDISIRQKLKPFNQFLQMEGVTEIAVNRPGQLYYEREGVWNQVSVPSLTYDALIELGITAAKYSGDNVNFSKTDYCFRHTARRRTSSIYTASCLLSRTGQSHDQKTFFKNYFR